MMPLPARRRARNDEGRIRRAPWGQSGLTEQVASPRAVRALLDEHHDAALHAFNETLEHRLPGSLEARTETNDD